MGGEGRAWRSVRLAGSVLANGYLATTGHLGTTDMGSTGARNAPV